MRIRTILAILMTVVLGAVATPAAAKRVALVIGNDAYASVKPLTRAVADARAIRDLLRDERGFEVVYAENAGLDAVDSAVAEFLDRIEPGDTAMVAFSGHGVQLDRDRRDTLFLLPTDIPNVEGKGPSVRRRLARTALNFATLADDIRAAGAVVRLFVLDACRDNPFDPDGTKSIGMSRGLGAIRQVDGEFVFYAAAPGERALDRLAGDGADEANSVFTRAFLRHFRLGAYLEDVANAVQAEVATLTRPGTGAPFQQRPYYVDGILDPTHGGKACIDDRCGASDTSASDDRIEADYARAERVGTAAAWRAFLATYGDRSGEFLVEIAQAELEALEQVAVAPLDQTPPPASVAPDVAPAGPATRALGLTVATLTDETRRRYGIGPRSNGIAIVAVAAGSTADAAGLAPGTVIVEVAQTVITDPAALEAALQHGQTGDGQRNHLFLVRESGALRFVAVAVPEPVPSSAATDALPTGCARAVAPGGLVCKAAGLWFDPAGSVEMAESCFVAVDLVDQGAVDRRGQRLYLSQITVTRRCGPDRVRLLITARACPSASFNDVGSFVEPGEYTFSNPKRMYYSFGGNPGEGPIAAGDTLRLAVFTRAQVRAGADLSVSYRLDTLGTPRPRGARGYPPDPPCL